LLDNANILIK